jgi:riboflavin synthase
MFSGIVDNLYEVVKAEKKGDGDLILSLDIKSLAEGVSVSDSVSVNGVCLTAVKKDGSVVDFDVMRESLNRTNLGLLQAGHKVNIELSLRPTDRMGGHFVSGHVDGTGSISKKEQDGRFLKIWFSAPKEVTEMLVPKGSVALDGVSMTVVDIEEGRLSVCCIPHTLELTTLGSKKEGDKINIEIDMIGKWVKKILDGMK